MDKILTMQIPRPHLRATDSEIPSGEDWQFYRLANTPGHYDQADFGNTSVDNGFTS